MGEDDWAWNGQVYWDAKGIPYIDLEEFVQDVIDNVLGEEEEEE